MFITDDTLVEVSPNTTDDDLISVISRALLVGRDTNGALRALGFLADRLDRAKS
jgi:hypothetical protein